MILLGLAYRNPHTPSSLSVKHWAESAQLPRVRGPQGPSIKDLAQGSWLPRGALGGASHSRNMGSMRGHRALCANSAILEPFPPPRR